MDNPVRTYFGQSNLSPSSVTPSGGSTFYVFDMFGLNKRFKKVNKTAKKGPPAPMSTLSVKQKEECADLTCRLPVRIPPHHLCSPLAWKSVHPGHCACLQRFSKSQKIMYLSIVHPGHCACLLRFKNIWRTNTPAT